MSAPIPTTLDEAVAQLVTTISDQDRAYVQSVSMDRFMGNAHHGAGMALRNEWHLWETTGPLNEDLAARGYHHGDDCSGIILSLLWRRVNGVTDPTEEAFIVAQAESNRIHWAKQGIYPDGKPIPGVVARTIQRLFVKKDGTIEETD